MDLQDRAVDAQLGTLRTLVVGDSHAQGIHYAVLPDTLHIASPGESVIQTYYRVRRILERDPPRIERVVVSLGVHSLVGTKWSIQEPQYWVKVVDYPELVRRAPDPWARAEEAVLGHLSFVGLGVEIWRDGQRALRDWRKGRAPTTWQDRLARWDGPETTPSLDELTPEELERMTRRTVTAHTAYGADFDPVIADHLERLLALCREHGIDALVVEMPVTPRYLEEIGRLVDVERHDRFVREAVRRQGADLLDLRRAFDDPGDFSDPEHLSPEGRAKATLRVRRHLEGA